MSEPVESTSHPSERINCMSLVLCDTVIEDTRSKNRSLINMFNTVFAYQMPFILPHMAIMASVTNIRSKTMMTVSIKDPELRILFEATGELVASDPTQIVDLVVELRNLRLETFGTHFVDVSAHGLVVNGRRFEVVHAPMPPDPREWKPPQSE